MAVCVTLTKYWLSNPVDVVSEPWVERCRVRVFLTVSQLSFSMSTKILMSSGMAMAGWVSFSWMAT